MLKLDLHLHSCFSDDGTGSPLEYVKALKKRGLQGMALTDHNTIHGYRQLQKNTLKDFLVLPGIEISTADGHLLVYNVMEEIPSNRSIEETIERVNDCSGVPVIPHLFRLLSGIKKEKLNEVHTKIPAVEVFNGCSIPATNLKTAKIAHELGLGGIGGSDSHDPHYAGYAYTTVNSTDLTIDTILSEIQKKKTWGEGLTMPLAYRRDRMILSVRQYMRRGFRRI